MKNENNFELTTQEINDMEQVVEIKDEEMKQVTGGYYTEFYMGNGQYCKHVN